MTTNFDQKSQHVNLQYNINAETVIVSAEGFLRSLSQNKRVELLNFLQECKKELPAGSASQEAACRLLVELGEFTEANWVELLNISGPSSKRYSRAKRDLGILVVGLALGIGGKSIIDIYVDLDGDSATERDLQIPAIIDSNQPIEQDLREVPAFKDNTDPASPSFSYYLIGVAEGFISRGNLTEARAAIDLAIKIDPDNVILLSLKYGISNLPDSLDPSAAIELKVAQDEISEATSSLPLIPISKAAAKLLMAKASSSGLSAHSFAEILEQYFSDIILPDEDAALQIIKNDKGDYGDHGSVHDPHNHHYDPPGHLHLDG